MHLTVASEGITVPLVTGGKTLYHHLDHAASAPALSTVTAALAQAMPYIAAVHRGPGYLSTECTQIYEQARATVHSFLGASPDTCVILTSGATAAINILAEALGPEARVVGFAFEHHANMLPWARCRFTMLPVPSTHAEMFERLETELRREPTDFVTVTGASNVTGEKPNIRAIADLAHTYDARIMVDAAQLAAHEQINMATDHIDAVAISSHKFGASSLALGALATPRNIMTRRPPLIRGGGAVTFVHADGKVRWCADPTARHEAGSPNVPGAIATMVACQTIQSAGQSRDTDLIDKAYTGLQKAPGLEIYAMWGQHHPRVGVFTFNVEDIPYGLLGAVLSAEYGIGVRTGCFCAHPLMAHLLNINPTQARSIASGNGEIPGAVRISLGNGTTSDTLEALLNALHRIIEDGPTWKYDRSADGSHYWPVDDPRPSLLSI
jgi:selenocysteine lyase/cysteine desulfurase